MSESTHSMGDWIPRIVILALLAIILGVPALFSQSGANAVSTVDSDQRLVIMSPHNEQIRQELAYGYNSYRQSQGKPLVEFDWRSSGTSALRRLILDQFTAAADEGKEDKGIGIDIFFGGGEYDHNKIAKGVKIERDGKDITIECSIPAEIPDDIFSAVYPQELIGGERLYHKERRWVGTALSSFGIIYNQDVVKLLDAPTPGTWTDLIDEQEGRYRGWIGLADPAHSGSITATYHNILRRMGWTEGWSALRRIFANARYFAASSSKVPVDVSTGEAAAGMCIDFYGRYQAGKVGGDRMKYVDPPYMTAITADTISILRGAPSKELANDFVLWVISEEGQQLWQRRAGEPGGPQIYELRRMPVRRDMYTDTEMQHWVDSEIRPFEIAKPLPDGMPDFFRAVAPICHAIAIDIHADLKQAWDAIVEETDPAKRDEKLELFDMMPADLTVKWPSPEYEQLSEVEDEEGNPVRKPNWLVYLEDTNHANHEAAAKALKDFRSAVMKLTSDNDKKLEWTLFFRANYRKIANM